MKDITEPTDPLQLEMFVIYDHPSDYPDCFVVRRFEWDQPKQVVGTAMTLDQARDLVPPGLVNLHRHDTDDPKIVEVWI